MMIQYPEYGKCTANIACSVLKHFGIGPPNPTYTVFDRLLAEREYKNIVVLLLDGLGTDIIGRHLKPDGFFRSNFVCSLSSTFPPTTVASTTAIMSGLYPAQSGWLGWVGYFPEMDRNIVYFRDKDHDDGTVFEDSPAWKYRPYESIFDRLNDSGTKAYMVSEFTCDGIKSFDDICRRTAELCAEDGRKYIYSYWAEPDHTMHKMGTDCDEVHGIITALEAGAKGLSEKLEDTLLIVTADHGHRNIVYKEIDNYPDICECLVRRPSIEPRAVNMFVKPERMEDIPLLFKKHFGNKFMVLTREEVIDRELFGTAPLHPGFKEMLGDYLAIGVGDIALYSKTYDFVSDHAGMTPEEMTIPFIAVRCNK